MRRFVFVVGTLLLIPGCHRTRELVQTFTSTMVVQELHLPACKANAPLPFIHKREAEGVSSATSPERLVVRIAHADTLQRRALNGIVLVRQSDRASGARTDSTGTAVLDSLFAGRVDIEVRAIGFNRLRDTVEVRSGFVDTILVGLLPACT